ncbi:methylated-DNA--[protein]-cysteine S-methyltransferase [Enterococcus camelliae]|uniref:Methylated-DNA--protein-cysteine methyltransferase n=1 Tax=Enterococcus camelliae TaxID=453959 RepID=A0ABW5TI15_9ENTE
MLYKGSYQSPLGKIELLSDDQAIVGLWFENQKYYGSDYDLADVIVEDNAAIIAAKAWLDDYFLGEKPDLATLHLKPHVTEFRKKVLEVLEGVPYGKTITYKEIADKLNAQFPEKKTSARAVGGAVGHNPISIFIPCHRVVGSDGSLTGYAGGIDRKIELLTLEGLKKENLQQLHI